MRPAAFAGWVVASMLTLLAWPEAADGAARWVRFNAASQEPSALAVRRAEERGQPVMPRPVTQMRGMLLVPRGEGPFPAVVIVHDCRGVRPYAKEWARTIASWGYVTLLVDSFHTRHTPSTCSKLGEWSAHESVGGRIFDAYGALEYLQSLGMVARDRVAVMGWADGAPLSAVSTVGARTVFDREFKAAIALTPDCGGYSMADFAAPLLVLAAGRDDWMPAESCRRMAREASPVTLHVYPEARHGFDDPELVPAIYLADAFNRNRAPTRGATLGYDGRAHRDAVKRVQEFLARHLGTVGVDEDSEIYALVPAIDEPPASTWVVDPDEPGPDVPPVGRSLFDRLFSRPTADGAVYDLPFPFARLLERIEAPLRVEGDASPVLKKTLIPLGRSLQRHAAAPEYFKFPRLVVAVDSEPRTAVPGERPIMLKDRLFIGYQAKTGVVEIISYNERAARFEFQVVTNYRAGRTPRVTYAERAICTSCHQNGAPLFSEAGWDETDTNARVADALATERGVHHGVSMRRCCSADPAAIDNATDRANLFSSFQLLWREGCVEPVSGAISAACRGAALTAMLQFRMSAYSHFDTGAPEYRDRFLPLFMENWRRSWPDGLNIPNPNIPNRKPLLSPRPAFISAELDPLKPRPPLAIWRVESAKDRQRMIAGFAEFLPSRDVARLDRHLHRTALDADPPRERLARTCPVRIQKLLGGAELLVVRCEDAPGSPAGAFELLADLVHDGDGGIRGSLVRLELAGGELFTNLRLPGGGVGRAGATRRARLEVLQRRHAARARRADGDALAVFEVAWPEDGEDGDKAARVALEVIPDFAPVREAVAAMVRDPESLLASPEPFRGTIAMAELLDTLGLPTTKWCCDDDAPIPPLVVASAGDPTVLRAPITGDVPAAFYERCAGCHRGETILPPGFMRGPESRVHASLSRCAERIFVRLGMWGFSDDTRAKSPMPPSPGTTADGTPWHAGDEYRRMLAWVGDLLAARTGTAPDLAALVARGYENLPTCLPIGATMEASRETP